MKVFINDGQTVIPVTGNCYILGKDGIYLRKDTGLIQAVVKIPQISMLKPVTTSAQIQIPKIPAKEIARSLLFFRRVWKKHKTEAMVLLYYNKEQQRFYTTAPVQKTSSAGVSNYEVNGSPGDNYRLIGTIHSHCDFGAFHSGTDTNDEKQFDGIHITLGHIDDFYFDISICLVVNNNRFKMEPEDVILKIRQVSPGLRHKKNVRDLGIDRTNKYSKREIVAEISAKEKEYDWSFSYKKEKPVRWDLILPENMDYRNIFVPDFWLENVSPIVYEKETVTSHQRATFSDKDDLVPLSISEDGLKIFGVSCGNSKH